MERNLTCKRDLFFSIRVVVLADKNERKATLKDLIFILQFSSMFKQFS